MPRTTLVLSEELKKKLQKKTKQDGISLSAVSRMLLRDYANGKISIGAQTVLDTSHIESVEPDQWEKEAIEYYRKNKHKNEYISHEELFAELKSDV